MACRAAAHSGSWYNADPDALGRELDGLLSEASQSAMHAKALICPHAGYQYSAKTAAWAWKNVDPKRVHRVFVFGPSHHVYLQKCALPERSVTHYATPFGTIPLDTELLDELRGMQGYFEEFPLQHDQNEHSVEQQLPFLHFIMRGHAFTLVPVVVGVTSAQDEKTYGELFAKYFADPGTMFVISSDFCHWGKRFRYTYLKPESQGKHINDAISDLDRQGIALIEQHKAEAFALYLKIQGNTICGRHPICILLRMLERLPPELLSCLHTKMVHYSQSSRVESRDDSCVAYAALVTALQIAHEPHPSASGA
ncbi:unnamed protein product [Vitrella brassicaformis CCMP3155]|uniref:Uncharacterized protein n=2 Tax=Vitrella brassicaformis TaxID=1169539 RepID=A0A0G4EI19_VITBC|nr:unnamed protein product [Vitrella brassicaformis CCMP3155]|mmetsp:Transcript_5838/g.13966  ORF Transcript_5838/g.13966 Transcript_5838/m.13966 type:complete len:310 (+) Transcript_5838:268-1197(+)|eukprot:CEL95633.1 unnamed protein product [Vitrella brassicaformis CCMP3155]